jgi:hypothetical protein
MSNAKAFTLEKSECVPLTRELATQFAAMEASPTERPLNPARIKYLTERAYAGQLVTFHWAKALMGSTAPIREIRVNGQTSSNMLLKLDGAFPSDLYVHIDTYAVADMNGALLLFRQFDARESSRKPGEVAGVFQMANGLTDISKPLGKLGVEGYAWWNARIERLGNRKGDDRYSFFSDTGLHPFLHWYAEVCGTAADATKLKKIPIIAAMYETYEVNEMEARIFWPQVGGNGYDETSWAAKLCDALEQCKELESALGPGNLWHGVISSWNNHRKGKEVGEVRFEVKNQQQPLRAIA